MEKHEAEPPEIRDKLASLQSQKALIKSLTKCLKQAKTEYNRLLTEINNYRASVAPIQKCPEEVLLMIFQAYSKNNPALVTHLLPVCHRWYDISVNSPGLWSHINVRFGMTRSARAWDVGVQAASATQMIRTCLKHSASVPLHVRLNCRDLESAQSRLNEYLFHCLQEIGPSKDPHYFWEYLELTEFDLTPMTTDASRCHPDRAIETIYELIGTKGKHIKRWESLEIIFPEEDYRGTLGAWIWRLFNEPAPNLVKLSVSPMSRVPQGDLTDKGRGFSDLSSLEVLELLHDKISDLDFLPLKFDSIKCLTLETDNTKLHQSLQLSRFTRLERLNLHCNKGTGTDATSSGTISLPCLQTLSFSGHADPRVRWNVPTLRLLEIGGYLEVGDGWLPDIQAVHVRLGDYFLDPEHQEIQSCLHQILSKYTAMQKLTLPTNLLSTWEGLVQELTQKQELPPGLPVVLLASDEDDDDDDNY